MIETTFRQVWPYLSRHWFKIGLIALLLFVLLRKDLSFSIRLGAPPAKPEQQLEATRTRRETLTDASTTAAAPTVEKESILDKLNIFSGSGSEDDQLQLLQGLKQENEAAVQTFINRFVNVAQAEQEKYGIPASITLANGLLHSRAGQREAARQANNYFALPCTSDWQGPSGTYGGECLRQYDNAWTSFRDHSLYLTTGAMSHLKENGKNDYRAWARGLEKAGYGNTPRLARQLESVIDQYQLFQYD